jgi:HEAT repeat protein
MAACLLLPMRTAPAAEDEARMVELLQSPQTPPEQKDAICQKLRITGSAKVVPALASLLMDENLSQSARLALEPMPLPEAAQALRDALLKTTGKTKAGIIDSLGERRERESAAALAGLVQDRDPMIASSAALALGKIGGPQAIAALQAARPSAAPPLRTTIVDALLLCADGLRSGGDNKGASTIYRTVLDSEKPPHLRAAAFRGLVLAAGDDGANLVVEALAGEDRALLQISLQLVREVQGEPATKAFAGALAKAPPDVQVSLVEVLAQRGDGAATGAILALANSPSPAVRCACLTSLGVLGDESVAMFLAQTAAGGARPEQEAARQSLARLRGAKVCQTLLAGIAQESPAVRSEIARALGARQDAQAVPMLLAMAEGTDEPMRLVALQSLAQLATVAEHKALTRLMLIARTDAERDAAEGALLSACARGDKPQAAVPHLLEAMEGVPAGTEGRPARMALLRVAGRLGGDESLQALRAGLVGPDPAVQETALRTMAEFGAIGAADDLLKLSADPQRTVSHRVIAMRGYWRIVGAAGDRSADQRLRLCEAGLAASPRPEEKKLGLAELSKIPHPDALKLAQKLCGDEAVRDEAESACVRIAAALAGSRPDEARSALRGLEKDARSPSVRASAGKALEAMDQYVGYITVWSVAGPYRQAGKQCQELFDIAFPPEQAGAEVTWKPLAPPADPALFWQADLLPVAGGEQCVVYVRSRVWSPREQKVLLEIGSDDGVRIWVNRKVVHANNVMRPLKPGSDKAQAALKEGWNDVLVKVTQNNMGCGVCVRIRSAEGAALEGLRFDAGGNP